MASHVVCVSGPLPHQELVAGGTRFVAAQLFFDKTDLAVLDDPSIDDDISLQNLWKTKQRPASNRSNCFMDSTETVLRELQCLKERTVVLDISAKDRNITALHVLSERLPAHIQIACCASPRPTAGDTVETVAGRIVSELLLGVTVEHPTQEVTLKPSAISCALRNSTSEISPPDLFCLRACALAQCEVHGVPLVIEFEPWSQIHSSVVKLLIESGAGISRVIMCRSVLSRENLEYFAALLAETGTTEEDCQLCICVDSFGTTELPIAGPSYPTDEEVFQSVYQLIKKGYGNRLILSPSIRYRIDLRSYGGPGYAHVHEVCESRLLGLLSCPGLGDSMPRGDESCESLAIPQILGKNGIDMLAWFKPPECAPVEQVLLTCSICGSVFPPGDHFEKFNHLYCSSKCLSVHRKAGWV